MKIRLLICSYHNMVRTYDFIRTNDHHYVNIRDEAHITWANLDVQVYLRTCISNFDEPDARLQRRSSRRADGSVATCRHALPAEGVG
jgi:hypothetical protein